MKKARFDIENYVKSTSNGKILVEIIDFPDKKDGTKSVYEPTKAPQGSTALAIVQVDREHFFYADKKLANAILYTFDQDKKVREKGNKIIDNFIDRRGTYSKIKDKENLARIKDLLKTIKGFELEALCMAAEALKDGDGDLAEIIIEDIMNHEIC